MTDNSFDKFIKDKLGDYPSPVPDGLWERIKQEKDKKPVAISWWKNYRYFTFVGIAAILLGTTFFFNNDDAVQSAITKDTQHPSASNNTQSKNSTSSLVQPGTTNETTKPSTAANSENTTSKTLAESRSTSSPSAPVKSLTRPSTLDDDSGPLTRALTSKWASQREASKRNNYQSGFNTKNIITQSPTTGSYNDHESKPVFIATAEMDRSINQQFGSELIKGLKEFKLFGLDNCPSARGPIRNDIYIELYGSPDYARKTINNAVATDAAFLQRKDSTESMRLSYTAGFRLTKAIGENLLLKAGLQYSQINEKFSYRNENERRLTTVITIRTVVRPAGDTIVRDTSTVEQIGYRVKTTYNRYRSIDLPLLIGYEWGNDNFKAAVSGGVILNIYSWQRGESLDTSYLPVAFNKGNGQTFKRNVGVGLYAGFSLLKKTGDRTELFMEPYFRYNISNMTNNKSMFNQKFQVAGINIGVRYKLNGARQQ